MGDNKNLIIGILMFMLGGFVATTSNLNNSSNAENNVTINQENPGKYQEKSEIFRNFQNFSEKSDKIQKKSEKININNATLQEFKDAKVGIGETKFKKLVDNRPYETIEELYEKDVVGYYVYRDHRDRFKVGD